MLAYEAIAALNSVGVGERLSGQTEKKRQFDRVPAIHQASFSVAFLFLYTNQ